MRKGGLPASGAGGRLLGGLQQVLGVAGGHGLAGNAPFAARHVLDDHPGDLADPLAVDRRHTASVSFVISSRFCSGVITPSIALKLTIGAEDVRPPSSINSLLLS